MSRAIENNLTPLRCCFCAQFPSIAILARDLSTRKASAVKTEGQFCPWVIDTCRGHLKTGQAIMG